MQRRHFQNFVTVKSKHRVVKNQQLRIHIVIPLTTTSTKLPMQIRIWVLDEQRLVKF